MLCAYRLALHLLPSRVRLRHGAELEQTFADHLERAGASGPRRMRVFARALMDVLKRAPFEYGRRRYLAPEPTESGMMTLWTEIRHALRGAVRQPGLTALVVIMLALGIAASTTVFSIINGLFLRQLPFENPDALVHINTRAPKWDLEFVGINYPDYVLWEKNAQVFESLALYDDAESNVTIGETAERMSVIQATYRFGETLGLRPVLGRWFTAEEDRPDGPNVVVIGEDLWKTRLGGEASVIGTSLRVDGEPYTIVGIAPREAQFPVAAELWVPYRGDASVTYQSYSGDGVARLKPGVSIADARADLLRAHQGAFDDHDEEHIVSPRMDGLRDRYVADFRALATVLGGGVVIVLLVACANVASLMLARAAARRREISLRMSLGAGAGRLAVQLLSETLVLSLLGGAGGMLLGYWATRALVRSVPQGVPTWLHFEPDYRVVVFVIVASAVTAMLSGIAPVLQALRARPAAALTAEAGRRATSTRGQRRALNVLVAGEIALACMLLVAGGLLMQAYRKVGDVDPGFRAANVLQFRVALPESKYPPGEVQAAFYAQFVERLRGLPSVTDAGAITCPPLSCHQGQFYDAEGAPARGDDDLDPVVLTRAATPGYDRAAGLTLLRGRFLDDRDGRSDGTGAVVVNEMLAAQLWPGQDAVGRRIRRRGGDDAEPWWTVVGVTRNVLHYGLDQDPRPGIYIPLPQMPRPSLAVLLHTSGEPTSVGPGVRGILSEMDGDLPLFDMRTMDDVVRTSLAMRRTYSWVLAVFAVIALVLSVGGIYGVLSYVVGQRTQEIGIRVALGARRSQVMAHVLRHGLTLASTGIVIGVLASLGAGRLLSKLLFGVSARDAATYAAVVVILLATAALAAFVPTRRALAVQPHTVLRDG